MRILHVITRMILGGAQENTLLSVLGQMDAGHEVRLISGPSLGPEGSLVREALDAGVDYVEIPSLLRAIRAVDDVRACRALARQIREFNPDVVHTHSSKAGILGRMAAWRYGVPFVVHTIHGLPFHPYQSVLLNRLYIFAERFGAKRCHRILSVADAMTDQAVYAGIAPRAKFETVYSGMRMDPFLNENRDIQALRTELGIEPEDIVIGKIARLFELKGHEYLLQAFADLWKQEPRLRLLLVGDGVRRQELCRLAERFGIGDRIVWAGLVPHDRVPDMIACMDMVVHCSLREGLARVLPQALLSGKPTVSFDVDGAREVIIDGKTGWLVPPRDVGALTEIVQAVLADPEEAATRARRGRELCRERFDWRTMASRLLDIYQKGLGSGP